MIPQAEKVGLVVETIMKLHGLGFEAPEIAESIEQTFDDMDKDDLAIILVNTEEMIACLVKKNPSP